MHFYQFFGVVLDPESIKPTSQPIQVLVQTEKFTPIGRCHFIDPIREQKASVFYRDLCSFLGQKLAVQVYYVHRKLSLALKLGLASTIVSHDREPKERVRLPIACHTLDTNF
jgi:hypothetical protein